MERIGRFVFRHRDWLVPAALLLVLVAIPPAAPGRWQSLLTILGIGIAVAGQLLRFLVIGYAYIRRGGANRRLSAPELVCTGIYAHTRNPMYVGDFLLVVGLALLYDAPAVYAVGVPVYTLALFAMVRAEERFLAERYGAEYQRYCARVNRFLPSLRGLRATLTSMPFDWRRVIRKEYGTTFAWVSAAFVIVAVRTVAAEGAGAVPELGTLALWYLPVPLLWALARWLKKSRRLHPRPAGVTPAAAYNEAP